MEVTLVVGLFWGIVVGLLARRKNRNAWAWGAAGAVSWVVALLILAFMPYKCAKCNATLTNEEGREGSCPICEASARVGS